MNNSNRPVSEILKNHEVDEPKKRTREDWRKAKELEEARKAGTAPAAVDEEGKDINPHIPQYISSSPWYFGSKGPTLKHQRPQPEKEKNFTRIEEHFVRGLVGQKAVRYRKGACENCGAMTHAKKDCLERPRKVGAKYSGEEIAPDELILPNLNLDFDGKRDRWNGFDPEAYQGIVDEFSKVEEAKRQLKEEKLKEDMMVSVAEKNREGGSEDDEDKYADDADMPGTKVDSKQRITVRNLRIREDVAKYLRNLDPNSAYYDPKTRSMRDNPYKSTGKNAEELQFAGDNFVRYTGDTNSIAQLQMFAWQAHDKGVNVHLQADPTKSELLNKEFDVKKCEYKHQVKGTILEKYGGAMHLQAPPKELLFAQTEDYVEYSRHGEIIKGNEKPIVRSKYAEDVYNNNHNSVWGSYWRNGQWGYKCCHSMVKQSYCTGEAGIEANSVVQPLDEPLMVADHLDRHLEEEEEEDDDEEIEEGNKDNLETTKSSSVSGTPKSLLEQHQESLKHRKKETASQKKKRKKKERKAAKKAAKKKLHEDSDASSSSSEEADSDDDSSEEERKKAKKLRKALHAEEQSQRNADELLKTDERKRPYNSMYEVKAPTEEEMEAYFMKRHRPEDPMALFLQPGTSKLP